MKNKIITLALLAFSIFAQAQKPLEMKVWPNGAPNSNGIEASEQASKTNRISSVTEPMLYVYKAEKPNGQAIVCCPGGGYVHLAMDHEGHDMASWFNSQGITFCVLKYRMPNKHKEVPLSDAREALKMVRSHANEWGVNPQKVGIMGSSAGGHLASTAATHLTGSEAPNFQILLYPVVTMNEKYTHMGSRINLIGENPSQTDIDAYSNEKRITDQTPPAFIALSTDDRTVNPYNTLSYAQAMVDHNLQVCVHMYPLMGHGWGFRDIFPYKYLWTAELERWLREIDK